MYVSFKEGITDKARKESNMNGSFTMLLPSSEQAWLTVVRCEITDSKFWSDISPAIGSMPISVEDIDILLLR